MSANADLFAPFVGYEAVCVAFAARMADLGLAPADVPALYEALMAARMADMVPVTDADRERAARAVKKATADADTRRRPGQADTEFRLGACPVCGSSEVWGVQKCPHIAPPWRVFFACDNDECSYHGRSRLTVEALRRKWPEGAEVE